MSSIADLIISITVWCLITHIHHAEAISADLPGLAVSVHQTLAGVVSQVADGGGVLAVVIRRTSFEQIIQSLLYVKP